MAFSFFVPESWILKPIENSMLSDLASSQGLMLYLEGFLPSTFNVWVLLLITAVAGLTLLGGLGNLKSKSLPLYRGANAICGLVMALAFFSFMTLGFTVNEERRAKGNQPNLLSVVLGTTGVQSALFGCDSLTQENEDEWLCKGPARTARFTHVERNILKIVTNTVSVELAKRSCFWIDDLHGPVVCSKPGSSYTSLLSFAVAHNPKLGEVLGTCSAELSPSKANAMPLIVNVTDPVAQMFATTATWKPKQDRFECSEYGSFSAPHELDAAIREQARRFLAEPRKAPAKLSPYPPPPLADSPLPPQSVYSPESAKRPFAGLI